MKRICLTVSGLGPTALHPEVGDIPLLRNALVANELVHSFAELPGDHFTALAQELRDALIFLLNRLGSQDGAALAFSNAPRAKHRECQNALRHNSLGP